jgi:hypothetical protein
MTTMAVAMVATTIVATMMATPLINEVAKYLRIGSKMGIVNQALEVERDFRGREVGQGVWGHVGSLHFVCRRRGHCRVRFWV